MTIEQEAKDIWNRLCGYRNAKKEKPYLLISVALQAKQDRIEELERKLELEKEELNRWQDSACRLEGNLDTALSTIEELEDENESYRRICEVPKTCKEQK